MLHSFNKLLKQFNGNNRIWTDNTLFFKQVLYQLELCPQAPSVRIELTYNKLTAYSRTLRATRNGGGNWNWTNNLEFMRLLCNRYTFPQKRRRGSNPQNTTLKVWWLYQFVYYAKAERTGIEPVRLLHPAAFKAVSSTNRTLSERPYGDLNPRFLLDR